VKEALLQESVARLDTLARRDAGGRGLATFAGPTDLLPAAAELLGGQRIILVTGFCIRAAMIGENDGPPGTLALADALCQLGKEVVLLTDEHSAGLLAAGAATYARAYRTVVLGLAPEVAQRQIADLVAAFAPTQVVAIERPGSAPDGHRYSMHGEILDDLVPAADCLLEPAAGRTYRTIAIGDGGNELGFGGLRAALKQQVKHGDLIFCSTAADHVIPAGISNWGANALVATLSLLAGRLLLRPPAHDYAVLQALLAAGAVDGCTRTAALSVDGLAWDSYATTLAGLYDETRTALQTLRPDTRGTTLGLRPTSTP
jgi:hypothetical protein